MRQIVDNPVICTDVRVVLRASRPDGRPLFLFETGTKAKHTVELEVGNVTAQSDIAIQLCLAKKALKRVETPAVLFQAQVYYTKLDGMKCCRTLTQLKKTSRKPPRVEKAMDIATVALVAVQRAGRLGESGSYEG